MDIVGCCFGGCVCFLAGMCCKVMFCDDNKENTPAAGGLPYPSQNPITNQPTSMPMPRTEVGIPMPMPNTDVGWNMSRPQNQPYPEVNSICPYPPLLTNSTPPPNPSNSSGPQPTAPVSTSTSSQPAQDCPPKYEDAINLNTH